MSNTPTLVYRPPQETPDEFLDIVSTAFQVDTLRRLESRHPPSSVSVSADVLPSRLHKISLGNNAVCSKFYVAFFSALRYRCPLKEDTSSHIMWQYQYASTNYERWRWIAFGLFYTRPKRFTSRFKLHTFGKLTLNPLGIETLVNTLPKPAADLVYDGVDIQNSPVADALMVCTVKKGASVEIFESGSPSDVLWTDTLAQQSELEALCEKEDGSVCVVVPGGGLEWV